MISQGNRSLRGSPLASCRHAQAWLSAKARRLKLKKGVLVQTEGSEEDYGRQRGTRDDYG